MATYEELLDFANNYNPQPQQELGVNSFNQGGMIQQEETPYQKMMRETYGNPVQQQEEQGILGSVANRMSGQPQQQGAEEPSFLSSLYRGAMAQGIGTLGGQADFVAGATGSETLRNLGDTAQKAMQEYSRPHEYTFNDIFGNGLSSVWKYLSDPNGAAYDIGGGLGSTAAMAAEAALLSAALPSSVAAAGTGAVAAFATRLGLKSVAGALKGGSTAGKLIKNVIASTPLEAASESGGTYREMTTDEQGNRLNMEDIDMDKVQEAMAKNFVGNLGVLGASNLLESVGIGKLFGEKMRQGILGKVRDIGGFMMTNAGQNAWEEGAQTGSNLYAQGKIDNISQIVNPFEWNPEQIDAATIGGIAGLGQGTFMGGAGHVLNKIAGPQQQEGNPAVNIQNKVTNEEFGDAVAIAKHDTSTNLVDRMRNLEGRIGHHASDGTNCARTIGLALAGTDYQDLINVDDFVKIAQNKGQLKDPNSYVPKPGDLAVVNDGNHIVMVSENGGTIQNGSSRDGVYESAQSPLQMFGSVKYYISTSDLSSGDYGVVGNLQGVNEEQRQQEYYKKLVDQERQRRADAIRDVLGAKTHEQEQQEQAVSEAQKYQQENASELGPINNYYNAFTEQELAALTPEQKQTLKDNFDSFYADKQNWGHTAIEKVQTARGMYNQMVANRQQTAAVQQQTQPQAQVQQQQAAPVVQRQATPATAPATNVQQQVAQPTPTQTANVAQAQTPQVQRQAAPTTTPTTETAVSPTEKQKPVVQQQNYKTRSEAAKDLPSRIQKAVADANGDYAKLHSALTTEATDLENDLSFGKITEDEYKTAKAQLNEAQNKYLYNKNNQTTQAEISPDEWEKRLQKATEDLGEAYRNGNITKEEYERRMQAIDDAYDTNVTQKRGVTQYSSAETGFMERQAAEQKAIDENVAKGNRVKFMGMVDDLYKKRKNGQTEEDKKLIASQTNAAFKAGLAMLDKGATAEEAFDAVKDSIGTEKQKAKAKADAEKQAKKGEKKNAVTEQKSTELQKPEAEQGRDKDVNAKPEEGKREENKNGQTAENKGKAEVRENGNNEGTVSEASGTSESGSISEDGRGREAEPVSGHEGGTGETVLRANDENVRDQKSDRGEDAASGLSEQSTDVGGTANGQDAVRRELSTAEQTYNGDLEKTNKAVEDGNVSVAEAKKQAEAAANEFDKELDKAEAKAEAPTTGKGDPIIVSDSLRKAYEELKNIIVKVGKNLYRLAIVRSKANNDGVMRWETTNGKPVSSDEALRCLLYEAIKTNDNGDFVTLDEIIANLEKKKEQVGLTPNFQEALDLAKKLKKENVKLATTNNEQSTSKAQTGEAASKNEIKAAQNAFERKMENIKADLSFDIITQEKANQLMKEAQEELKNALKKWANKKDSSAESALTSYKEERNKWKAEDRAKTRSLRITLGNKTYSPIISDVDPFGFVRIKGWTDPNTGEQIKGELGRLLRWIRMSLGTGAFVDAKLTPGNVLMENTLDDVIERLEQIKKELTERSKTGRIPRMSVLEYAKQLKAEGQNATIHFAEDVDNTTPDNTTKYQAAYHGASTLFDTFTLEHTDKGINLHGWGLYFTKNRENAEKYQAAKSKGTYEVYSNGKRVTDESLIERLIGRFSEEVLKLAPERVAKRLKEDIAEAKKGIQKAKESLPKLEKALNVLENNVPEGADLLESFDEIYDKLGSDVWDVIFRMYSNNYISNKNDLTRALKYSIDLQNSKIKEAEEEIKTLSQVDPDTLEVRNVGEKGHLYEVDIPENDVLLDEQKKFGDQPEKVQRAIDKLYKDRDFGTRFYNLNGEGIYNDLVEKLGSKQAASELLNQYGVEGITYNDWEDGRCFVVFSDKAVQMMQRYESAVTNKQEEIKRSLDELITEAKRAFKGAKGFRINRNDLIFTMPNGLEMKVNIKDQILLSAADEAKARKEHGLTDPNQRITVEGYARRLDKGSLVALSKESGRGTAFHETFHTVWDWVLTEKEKAAMLKHFTPIAEKLGIDVEEAMADGYRDWLLARQQHKGTLFGKLYQKVLDFVNGALRVLTGTENVHDIYRQIEEGKVWNRDEKGRFAKSENSETNQGEKKFLVTNNKITADTQVPVIDVTNVARANTTDPAVRAAIANSLIGKTFRILGSDGIGFTQKFDSEILPDGRVKKSKPNEHLVRGAGRNEFDKGLVREERQKALSIADTILDNAMYIEKHPDANHGTDTRYVDLYAAVQNGDKIYPIHIQAKEKDGSAGEFVVGKAMYYQLTRKGPLPATAKQLLASANDNGPSISVAQLLQNVKDKAGRPYVINGQLNYESAALNALPSGTKYSMKYANPNDTTDYKNNPLAAEVSTRQTKAKGSTEDSETQRLIADLDAVKKDPALFKKLVDALKSLPGLATSERNTEKAAEIIINRIKDNIVYLYNQVPENIRERARKWYDGGNRVAKEWKKRYGISEHASAGIIAVLSPQKDWFTNMTLAERILDCIFGHANKMWTEEMSKQADGYSEMVEQPVKESKKEKAAREKRGEPVKTELVKVTHKSIVEGDENREALERARNKTLKQLLNAGDYEAAAIWIKCFDKAHNDRGYRVLTPEGGTGDYVKTSKGENAGAAWGDFGSIAKAVSIAVNPTWENISAQLGEQHKVRNFSNNLRFPGSLLNATIDTHAVGVGLMQPTSGGSQSVLDNFGEAGGSDIIGISGTYPLYFEAYRRAAAEISEREGRPLSAREMQSITWEAVRNLFPADMKTTEKEQSRIAGMLDEAKARLKRSKNKDAAIKKVKTEQEAGEKLVDAALEKVESGKNISDILAELKEQAKAKKLPRLVSLIEDAEKSVENHKKDKKKSKKPLDKKKLVNGIKNKWNGQEKFIQEVVEAEERIKAGVNEEEAYRDIKYKGKDQVRISNLFREADKQIKNLNDPVKVKEILDGVRKMVYNIATKGTDQLQKFSWESTPDDVPLSGTYDRSNVKITPFDNSAGGNDRFTVGFNIDPTKYLSPKNAELFKSLVESGKAEDKTQAESVLSKALKFATDWILAEFDIRENVEPTLTFQGKDGKLTVGYTVEISNPQQTVAVAKMFGRLFDPESVIATGTKEVLGTTGKSMAIELPAGWGPKEISELSNKLGQITDQEGNPLVATHSTSDGQMTFVNTSDWSDSAVLEDVKRAVPELNVYSTDEFATILDKNSYEDNSKEGGQHKREDYIGRAIAQRLAAELNPTEGQPVPGNGKQVAEGNRSGSKKKNSGQNERVQRKSKEAEQPAETGKIKTSIRAQVNFEVAPDPHNEKLKQRWGKLTTEEKQEASRKVSEKMVPKVLKYLKVIDPDAAIKAQIGGYMEDTNPSLCINVEPNEALKVSNALGHVFSQDSMMFISPKETDGSFRTGAIHIKVDPNIGVEETDKLYKKLRTIKDGNGAPLVTGHTTVDGEMLILNDDSRIAAETLAEMINDLIPDYEIMTSEVFAGFPEKEGYGYADSEQGAVDGKTYDEGLNLLREETSRELEGELDSAEGRRVSKNDTGLVQGERSGNQEAEVASSRGLLGKTEEGTGLRGTGGITEQTNEGTQGDEGASSMPENATAKDLMEAKFSVRPGNELAVKIPNGKLADGTEVKYAEALVSGKKHGETRFPKKNGAKPSFPTNQWVGISVGGKVIGRVKFGEPKLINKNSPEYKVSMIAGTGEDLTKERPEKWYYPVLEKQDFRNNPIDAEANGTRYDQYPLPSNVRYSIRQEQTEKQAELAQQKKDIRAQYEGTKQWMKAPNGEPSKLNEDQWVTVRTPQFKEWFGDWENDPENASKVVDENGEPRVVYHGTTWTPTKENGTFDKRRAGQNFDFVDVDYNFFFTASKEMAKGYGHALPLFLNIRNPEIYENEDHWMDKDEDAMFDALVTGHDFGDGVVKINDVRAKDADGVIYRGVVYNEESAAAYDKRMEELAKARRPVEEDFAERRSRAHSKVFDVRKKLFKKLSAALAEELNKKIPELEMTEERAEEHLHIMLSGRDGNMNELVETIKSYSPGSAANSEYDVLLSQFNEAKAAQEAVEKEYAESYQEYRKQLPDDPETELYNDANVYACDEPNQIKDASGNNVSITKDSDNIHYSITSAAGKALDKVEAYVNRNVRTPNENTATGRASKAFNNTQNKNRAQTWTEWLRDRFEKFYREWIDKNDAIHNVDDTIEKITGKKLAEEDKIYNMVQGARAYAQGAADTLVQGSKEAFESLKDALGRGIDPKDPAAMKRLAELKKDFKFATVKEALEPIMKKDMDQKYPDYLEKNGINNWHDAFSNYLGARRILELVRLVEDKSLQYITHDKKEFTDFIDRHPEYEKFRPQPFAKGSWRTQVQNVAKNDPALAEKMAKELAKEYKFPKGVTREDLEALVREAPKEFDTSAQIYYQLQRNLLTMMELGHLIPADVHDKVNSMYNDYCPLMIDYSDTAGLDTAIAQFGRGSDSIANVDSMLKHVLQLGSERGLISPLESTYKSIQALTNRAERNKVAVHFIKTVANSKELQSAGILKQMPGSSPDAKNCIFTALINGKKVAFQTTQDLYGPIVGYDMPAAGIVEGMCRSAAQALRYGATTSPSFIVRNFIRDTIFAGVSSRNGFVPVVDSFRGMWAYLHDKELRGEFDAMGITAYNYFGSGESAVKSMEELMGEKDWAYLKAHPTELIKELVKYVPKKFAAASEVVEASTRMGEYMKARKAGKSMQEAALDARDVTLDFSRSGFYGQRVNMMVPFFNACIQGGDKMFNRMLFSKDPKVRAQTLRMLGLYIMLPSVALWFMHKDEPWYEELDPHIKMNNWIIGKFRIPKPQEAGIAFGSGIEAILDKIYNKDPKAGKEWVNAMREVLVPNLIPTVGLPILEWVTNYSLFRDKAIEGNRLKRLPAEMRYNNSTTEVSKLVGAKTGLSPVKLDNTIRGYTGTLGMLTAQAFDWFLEENRNQPSKKVTERVMVRDFFLNDMNMNRTSEEFYEMANAAQQQHAGYGKKGHPTPAVKAVNKALRDVSKQQKEIQEITNAKNIGPSTKRQMIDKKRELIKMIQRKTLQRYRDKFNV